MNSANEALILFAAITYVGMAYMFWYNQVNTAFKRLLTKKNSFLAIPLGLILGILIVIYLTDWIPGAPLDTETYAALLTTSGTIIATIFAVSFSISLLVVQHALGNYAPSLLRIYLHDRATIISFALLSFSSFLNLIGLVLPWKAYFVNIGLYVLGYSFVILAYFFYSRTRAISTTSLLETLQNRTVTYMDRMSKSITKYGDKLKRLIAKKGWGIPDSYVELSMVEVFHFGNWLGPIKMYLRQIFSLVRANQQVENETSRSALEHVYTILEKYVQIRKPYPSDYVIPMAYIELKEIARV